ncbi:MAG TPA: endonuclease III [Tepidisphaeraceae bacterium]|nr:endonuclease III [Tepidisphaeraceae bacterium]
MVRPARVSAPARGAVRGKRPFDVDDVLARIETAIAPFDKAAMFELAGRGHASVFEQLVACVLSIRTLDEVSLPAALRLLGAAPTPAALARLGEDEIDALIRTVTFHRPKAATVRAIARRTVDEFGGVLPCDAGVLTSFRGVGPKCAHLALGVACGEALISVDVHVHRVTNRWGYVAATTPERTMAELQEKLPKRHWVDINRLLVPFGKHVCTGRAPRCSTCPVLAYCRQVGVTAHR